MTKKQKFFLDHPKIAPIYYRWHNLVRSIKWIGQSGDCIVCKHCKKQGCFKNRIAKKFKLARSLSADRCFVPKAHKQCIYNSESG